MTAPLPTSSRYTPHPSTLTPHGGTKAMILAAGKGTRLLPLTKHLPKCLMTLAGRPLIDWQLSWLKKHGVTECVINLHYLADLVRDYVGDGRRYGLAVHYSFEPELLGTAGAVKKVAGLFDEPFYVIYSDNFSRWDIRKLKTAYENVDCKEIDAVFHLAAKNCIADCQDNPVETSDINVRGTVNVFEAAKRTGVPKVIYAESSALYEGAKTYPTPENEESPCPSGKHA